MYRRLLDHPSTRDAAPRGSGRGRGKAAFPDQLGGDSGNGAASPWNRSKRTRVPRRVAAPPPWPDGRLLRRQSRDPLPRPACAGGERAGIIVARLGPVALEPDDAELGERRGIEGVAERDQRAGVARVGGADEESPRGGDVAVGEGDEAFGAEAARLIDRDCERRAGPAGLPRRRLVAQRARQFADRVLAERLRRRRQRLRPGRGGRGSDEDRLLDRGLDVQRRGRETRPACDRKNAGERSGDEAGYGFP